MHRTLYIPLLIALLRALAPATTYYVSSSSGSDSNSGTSSSAAWQTIAHVNAQTFQPGDSILFKRGDVWNESLVPPSSGTSGNPITFDAYGTGAPPNLTGYYPVPSSSWIFVSGNAWKAPLPATYSTVNFCLFGSIWGEKVSAVSTNLTAQWDFYFSNGYVYVYSQGNPATYYNEPIVPMALSNTPVININNQTWLTFQHFLINWFDQYGVYVQGTSDNLVFANMEADSMIPQGTQPLGFYVNESAPGPGDVKIYNSEAHLNYDGFRFDGAATAITMINDKGYANRDGALVDNTGAVTYSYCHFYASSLAVAGSTDVEWTSGSGPTAGAGNIPQDTPPAVEVYQRYPAMVTLTVDDAGMTPGADTYYANTVLPVAQAAGIPVGAAITVGYPLAQTLISEFQSWINQGLDVTSHSISHTYYVNTDAIDIQYIGSGSAATLSISNNTFTITVTGAAADSVTYNLAQGQPQGTMLALAQALAATGKYTYSFATPCQGPYGTGCSAYTAAALLSQDLADVSNQDVKTAVYHAQLNVTQLTNDEITLSRQWMTSNLTGLPSTPVYVYPGGYETTAMQGIAEGVPYSGARGALKEDLGVKDTYSDGFNAQNITSFGVNPSWMGIPPASLNQKIQALVWKESVWGVPWGIFWHLNELTQDDPVGGTEITNLINDFKNAGATVKTNTSLVNWLLTGTQETGTDGNYYYKIPATSMTLNFRPTEDSPVVDAGENLGPAYELDINGVNQNSYGTGWEIGAHVYQGYATYGQGSGPGDFEIGVIAPALVSLPQQWVDNNEAFDGLVYTPPQTELNLGTQSFTGLAASSSSSYCTQITAHMSGSCTSDCYYSGGVLTSTGLQQAINDVDQCRDLAGAGGFYLDTPAGATITFPSGGATNGLSIPQLNATPANSFIIVRSTAHASLPDGQTACSHGIQDNVPTSTDVGLNNPDCTGQNMYYELGPTQTNPDNGSGTGSYCVSVTMSGATATMTLAVIGTVNTNGTTTITWASGNHFVTGSSWNGATIYIGGTAYTVSSVSSTTSLTTTASVPTASGAAFSVNASNCASTWPTTSLTAGQVGHMTNSDTGISGSNGKLNTEWQILSVNNTVSPATLTAQACSFEASGTPTCLSGYNSQTAGSLNAENVITGHYTLSANSQALASVTITGSPVLIPLSNGYVSPPGGSLPGSTGQYSILDTVTGNNETVTAVSGANQSGLLASFAYTHPAGFTVQMCPPSSPCQYELAGTVGSSWGATPSNLVTIPTEYNDLQYMTQIAGTGAQAGQINPITFCNPYASAAGQNLPPQCEGPSGAETSIGPSAWMFEDIAVSFTNTRLSAAGPVIYMDHVDTTTTNSYATCIDCPTHIHFRHDWMHDWWTSLYSGSNVVENGVQLMGYNLSLVDSSVSEMLRPTEEGHSIGPRGTRMKINHNWLDCCSGFGLPGGYGGEWGPANQAGLFSQNYVPFTDVEVRRNRTGRPFAWLGIDNIGANINPNFSTYFLTYLKNAIELKSGLRFLFDGNVVENEDGSAQPGGYCAALYMWSVGSSGGGSFPPYWYNSQITNATVTDNIFRHTCVGILPGGKSGLQPTPTGSTTWAPDYIYIGNNLAYDISNNTTTHPYASGVTDSYGFRLDSGTNAGWTGTATVNSNNTVTFVATSGNYGNVLLESSSGTLTAGSSCATGDATGICNPSSAEQFTNNQGMPSGTLTTSGSDTVTWASGASFPTGTSWLGYPIQITSGTTVTTCTIKSITSSTVLTIDPSSCTFVDYSSPVSFAVGRSWWTTAAWVDICNSAPCSYTNGNLTNGTRYNINVTTSPTQSSLSCSGSECPTAGTNYYSAIALGQQEMDIRTGDTVPLVNCTGALASYNTPWNFSDGSYYTGPYAGYTVTSGATPFSYPPSSAMTTITFSVPGITAALGAGTQDTTCQTTNIQSSPENVTVDHNLMLTNNTYGINSSVQLVDSWITVVGKGAPEAQNNTWENNILWGGWYYSGPGPGCPSIEFLTNVATLTDSSNVFPGQSSSNYDCTYGESNYFFSSPSFNNMCGQWTTSFSTACTSGNQNLNVLDYHAFALNCSGATPSTFCAGQANQANDGTTQGPNILAIDSAQTLNTFACPYLCGSPGPYPDVW